jgi:hypothetical protein
MKLLLRRNYADDNCTMGVLSFSTPTDDYVAQTIERPWIPSAVCRGGMPMKSCVPPGLYRLVRHNTDKKPFTWALVNHELDVEHFEGDDHDPDVDRNTCLIHSANYAHELLGCIAPGQGRAVDANGVHMVTSSRLAMAELKHLLPWTDDHEIEVR